MDEDNFGNFDVLFHWFMVDFKFLVLHIFDIYFMFLIFDGKIGYSGEG